MSDAPQAVPVSWVWTIFATILSGVGALLGFQAKRITEQGDKRTEQNEKQVEDLTKKHDAIEKALHDIAVKLPESYRGKNDCKDICLNFQTLATEIKHRMEAQGEKTDTNFQNLRESIKKDVSDLYAHIDKRLGETNR